MTEDNGLTKIIKVIRSNMVSSNLSGAEVEKAMTIEEERIAIKAKLLAENHTMRDGDIGSGKTH